MKLILYTEHLKLRLKLRQIDSNLPRKIYLNATERYLDRATQKLIAVKRVRYKGKMREVVAVYEERESGVIIITIHPLKEHQKFVRIKLGRWQKL